MFHNIEWLQKRHGWPGLQAVVMVESTREVDGKVERETRSHITSPSEPVGRVALSIRSHGSIESAPRAHTRRRFAMN